MALIDNLVSYWKFDESSGNAADAHGSNTLTNNNSTAYAAGKLNNGIDFERSSSQYMSITDGSQSGLDITGSLSASFWIKFESLPSAGNPYAVFAKYSFSGGNNASYQFRLSNDSGTAYYADLSSDGTNVTQVQGGTVAWSTGVWYHIVFAFNSSAGTVKCYRNGSLDTTLSGFPSSLYNGTAPFTIGVGLIAGGEYVDGVVDEFGIWSKELSSTEVTELYNSGNALAYPFSSTTAYNYLSLLGAGQ